MGIGEIEWRTLAMSVAIVNEHELVELSTARQDLIPKRGGKAISPTTLWRWIKRGCCGVCLEVRYVGNTPYTSRDMVNRFIEKVTEARIQKQTSEQSPVGGEVSEEELRAAGLN